MKSCSLQTSGSNVVLGVVDGTNTVEVVSVNAGKDIAPELTSLITDIGTGNWFGVAICAVLIGKKLFFRKRVR